MMKLVMGCELLGAKGVAILMTVSDFILPRRLCYQRSQSTAFFIALWDLEINTRVLRNDMKNEYQNKGCATKVIL